MKQIKFIDAYNVTNELAKQDDLTITGKWVIYKLRKELFSHYEFYIGESRDLFNKYEAKVDGTTIQFKSEKEAAEFKQKQDEIDNFEVEYTSEKQKLKLSDIPSITIPQIETLEDFIEFEPE